MNSTFWLWLFRLAVVADLAAIYFQQVEVRYISKPLIVVTLMAWLYQQVKNISGAAMYFMAALLFSLAGDVFLLFEEKNPLFFMAGLGSFLLAHLLYITAFIMLRKGEAIKTRWFWIIATGIYGSTLLYMLMPYLGELKIPVAVYAFVLCLMLLSAVHAFSKPYSKPGIICVAGALLFVLSDTILAINKFYFGFAYAGLAIMVTYAAAQYFIITGAVKQLSNKRYPIPSHDKN
jgi:uncharacterized membrane protein YhhN